MPLIRQQNIKLNLETLKIIQSLKQKELYNKIEEITHIKFNPRTDHFIINEMNQMLTVKYSTKKYFEVD